MKGQASSVFDLKHGNPTAANVVVPRGFRSVQPPVNIITSV